MELARATPGPAHLSIKLRARATLLRCAFCHDDRDTAALAACLCGAVLHVDCRATLSRCPTFGCRPHVSAGTSWTTLEAPVQHVVRALAVLGQFIDARARLLAFVALGLSVTFVAAAYFIVSREGFHLGAFIHSVF